jgi:multidrug efflux pump subunit AcrB
VLRQSRAAALVTVALVVGGVLAARALPSSIYPPLEFPRIVIVSHSGTLPPQSMSLIVTRPIEQVGHGGARCPPRALAQHPGAAEISAQFDPSTDMVHGPADGAEPGRLKSRAICRRTRRCRSSG